jgi:hypothetical protein
MQPSHSRFHVAILMEASDFAGVVVVGAVSAWLPPSAAWSTAAWSALPRCLGCSRLGSCDEAKARGDEIHPLFPILLEPPLGDYPRYRDVHGAEMSQSFAVSVQSCGEASHSAK